MDAVTIFKDGILVQQWQHILGVLSGAAEVLLGAHYRHRIANTLADIFFIVTILLNHMAMN